MVLFIVAQIPKIVITKRRAIILILIIATLYQASCSLMDLDNVYDKQNQRKQILHSSLNKRVKVLGNSVILVAANMINQKKIMQLKKMKMKMEIGDQPALWSNKISLQYSSLDKNGKQKKQNFPQKQKSVSTINILKKQAQLLEEQDYLGRGRFSLSQLKEKSQQKRNLAQNSLIKTAQGKRKPFKGRSIFNKQNHALINWRKMDNKNNRTNLPIEKQLLQFGNNRRVQTSKKNNRVNQSFKDSIDALKVKGLQRRVSVGNYIPQKKDLLL